MPQFPVFLSVVLIVQNQAHRLNKILQDATAFITPLVSDYEIIVIDNASNDETAAVLQDITGEQGLPNIQSYSLLKEVDHDTASWIGLENALGDFIAVIDPLTDDLSMLDKMLDKAVSGADVVFAHNEYQQPQSLLYKSAYAIFNFIYKTSNGVNLSKEAPLYRVVNKRIVNYLLQFPQPIVSYRYLPATKSFKHVNLSYQYTPPMNRPKNFKEGLNRGMRMLVSTTRTPMRLVSALCLFGATANLLYSIYIMLIALFKHDIAPGWVSMSLQQSGMFFLISLVLLVLSEYLLHMVSLTNEGPLYVVGQELTSARMTRCEKLNVEEAVTRMSNTVEVVSNHMFKDSHS